MYSDGPHIFYKGDRFVEKYYLYHTTSGTKETKENAILPDNPNLSLEPIFHNASKVALLWDFPVYPDEHDRVKKIAAFGDVHGEFDLLVKVLKNNNIINDDYHWSFGDGHIVFCGDIFDRGNQVTECLWLIYSLEQQSRDAGGMVHLLLGNHELMAMGNDHRYLSDKYLNLAHQFKTPYSRLFEMDTVLGRWLRRKNTVVKLNSIVFVHAGLSFRMVQAGYTAKIINYSSRAYLSQISADEKLLAGSEGPFWYRGYMMNWAGYKRIDQQDVAEILEFYNADKIVFAHTPVPCVQPVFKSLIAIDVAMEKSESYEFLWIENGVIWACGADGKKRPI
jgi:hypothetical protein